MTQKTPAQREKEGRDEMRGVKRGCIVEGKYGREGTYMLLKYKRGSCGRERQYM